MGRSQPACPLAARGAARRPQTASAPEPINAAGNDLLVRSSIAVAAAGILAALSGAIAAQAQDPAPPPATVARPATPTAVEELVFRAFPEADAYSSIVRDVKQEAREAIERRMPFKLHFQELGQHTLLVAFRGRKPIGLVYLRSEESQWGLTEIAWSLSLDLRVLGFEVVRGRGPHFAALAGSAFPRLLAGRDFDGVVELVAKGEAGLAAVVPEAARPLAVTILRSSAKALVVTGTVWPEEVAKLHDQAIGYEVFPGASRFTRRTGAFSVEGATGDQRADVKAIHAYDAGGALLGSVLRTETGAGDARIVVRWVVDRAQVVVQARLLRPEQNRELRAACTQLEGSPLGAPRDLANPLAAIARGLGVVALNPVGKQAPR